MPRTKTSSGPLFADFVKNAYLPHIQQRKRSWRFEEHAIARYITPVFGKRVLARVSRNDVENWLNHLPSRGLIASSCNRYFNMLRAIFSHAVRWGLIPHSPCATVCILTEDPPRERYLSRAEASTLLSYLAQHRSVAADAIRLLLLTGARRSEIFTARWENVNLAQHVLTVPLSKNGKPRHIILCDAACVLIASLPRPAGSPWLFPGKQHGSPLRSVDYLWNDIRKRFGLHDVRIHDLRHTFASLLVAQGSTLYEVQRLLGHSNPKTTMRYAHFEQERLMSVAQSYERTLAPQHTANELTTLRY